MKLSSSPPASWRSLVALWAVLLAAAPPLAPWLWGVNALRSNTPLAQLGVCTSALLVGTGLWVASRRWNARAATVAWACAAVIAVILVSVVLRERAHILGDTWVRIRTLANYPGMPTRLPQVHALAFILHAAPLDMLINVLVPLALRFGAGVDVTDGVAIVCAVEMLVFFAGVWRLVRRLDAHADPAAHVVLATLVCTSGSLAVFAGYAESAGLVLALAPWWCNALLAPLSRPRDAWHLATTWALLLLAHRMALVLAVPVAWRLCAPHAGDASRVRALSAVAGALALTCALALGASSSGAQLARDRADVATMWLTPGVRPSLPLVLGDLLNTLAVVAPAAVVLCGFFGNAVPVRVALRNPRVQPLCAAVVPLVLLAPILPWGRSGLGGQRDWDLSVLLGFLLTLTIVLAAAAAVPAATMRRAAVVMAPLIVLQAGAWIALQANERACLLRADALLRRAPALPVAQQVHLASYLGERCRVTGYPEAAAQFYEHAAQINPNPNDALRAADAFLAAGRPRDAQRMLDHARRSGRALDPIAARSAAALDSALHVSAASAWR